MKALDLVGQTFTRLAVLSLAATGKGGRRYLVRCTCGRELTVASGHLRSGRTKSCGCLGAERRAASNTKHGHARKGQLTAEYRTWIDMVDRCERPSHISYPHYGARGIRLCEAWRSSFEAFLADVGPKPSSRHSIERIDVNGNYEPSNCRWATRREQARNTRRNLILTIDGVSAILTDWAATSPVSAETIRRRVLKGWDHRTAVFTPARPMRCTKRVVS